MKKLFLGLVATILCSSCSDMVSEGAFETLESVNNGNKVETDMPGCTVEPLEYVLDTHIAAFEISDKKNVSFGFNLLSGFFNALGLSIKVEKGHMHVFMHLFEATKPFQSVTSVSGVGTLKGKEFRFNLGAQNLGLDVGYYNRTPLVKLSEKALSSGLSNTLKELRDQGSGWRTRIAKVSAKDRYIVVPVGTVAGLKKGDELAFYNVERVWLGEPCQSDVIEKNTTVEPLAIAKVIEVENFAALFEYYPNGETEFLRSGGRAVIHKLTGSTARTLKFPVAIRAIESEKLFLPDGTKIDITPYAEDQISALFNSYGFYPTSLKRN